MAAVQTVDAHSFPRPRWTIPSFRRTPGRYPLGIEAIAFGQLSDLASGLAVLSRHPRYWSIYTYIIKRFWVTKQVPQTNAMLGRFLKAHEVVFACASLLCQRHGELPGIIGRNTFAPKLREIGNDDIPIDLDYLEQRLGGYGQVYRGAMADLGLVVLAENNPGVRLDAPFGELGSAVADGFAHAISGTTYWREFRDQTEGSIPLGVIRELAEASCFCRLAESISERDLLTDVLLGRAQRPHPSHQKRAKSIRLFLELADVTTGTKLDEESFLKLTYFGSDGCGPPWQPSADAEPIWRQWRIVCLRTFLMAVLNGMLVHFVRWGLQNGGAVRVLDFRTYADLVRAQSLPPGLATGQLAATQTTLGRVVEALDPLIASAAWPVADTAINAPLSETTLIRSMDRGRAPGALVLGFLALLLAQRRHLFMSAARQPSAEEIGMLNDRGDGRVGTAELFDWLEQRVQQDRPLADTIIELLRVHVIRQHLHIARGKVPEDTFRFHQEGGGYRFVDQGDGNGINPISMRFEAIGSALADLDLIGAPLDQPEHAPKERGWAIIRG